ncbi:MAG: DUF2207 family protein [Micromonosporaceae bacterium]
MPLLATALFLTGGGSLVVWLLILAGIRIWTRPRTVLPDPPTDVLGSSRPAVANMLAQRWRCTPDAVAGTLLDFLARGFVAVRADDPDHPVLEIHQPDPPNLTRYERRLMGRLRTQARNGRTPVSALAFHTRRAAQRWLARYAAEVSADARARDLARVGVNTDFLSATALIPSLALGAWAYLSVPSDRLVSAIAVSVAILLVLHQLAVRVRERYRPTPAGRAAAAHWLGVRTHLRESDPELATAEIGDAAAAQQRTAYAVALGVAPGLSEQLRLTPARHRRVLARDRALRVAYPDRLRFCWGWGGLGCTGAAALALIGTVAGAALLRGYGDYLPQFGRLAGWVAVAAGALAAVGLAALAIADVVGSRDRTGTVVLLEDYTATRTRALAGRYVLAVADGDRDLLDAWILPGHLGEGLGLGSTVTLRVRRWTGLVSRLAVVRGATPEPAVDDLEIPQQADGRTGASETATT